MFVINFITFEIQLWEKITGISQVKISDYTSGDNKYTSIAYKVNEGNMITLYITWE
jgi:hypothetical protein